MAGAGLLAPEIVTLLRTQAGVEGLGIKEKGWWRANSVKGIKNYFNQMQANINLSHASRQIGLQ
jgi:hypothetical protein